MKDGGKSMKVVGYIRVSTDQQEASGLGLEAQLAKIKGYCQLYDLELVEILQDAASGKNMKKRPNFLKALSMLKSGEAEGLIVAKLDRLTRSLKDLGFLIDNYFAAKFNLFVVCEQVDTRSANGRMVLNIMVSIAQWEREIIGERTRDALQAKRTRGEKTGGTCPYGFTINQEGKLIESQAEQSVIRLAVSLRVKGYSYARIAQALNDKGIQSKTGSVWFASTAQRIIERKAA
jgi:DNA invertase Pin-like site-specific DNA recombinase